MLDGAPIDLVSPASFERGQPHEQFRWLRNHDPVHFHPERDGAGFWAVTRYADVQTVSRNPLTYSSWLGGVMLPDSDRATLDGSRLMMLFQDAPDHTRHRRFVSRAFTPRAAARWGQRIRTLATQIVDTVIERGECDLVTDMAGEMPSYVIAELMGIPREDGRRLYELTEAMHAVESGEAGGDVQAQALGAIIEMHTYAAGVSAAKRTKPGDDLATLLLDSEIDGKRLSAEEFNWFFLLLVNAGGDTTRNLVAGGVEALLDQHQWDRLRTGSPALIPTAVEELLRFVSPVVHMRRTAATDTVLGNQAIRAGEKVVVFYGSANRDDLVFDDADRLDLARSPNPHLAFGGGGPHFCLGAHIARLEAAHLLAEIASRMPDLQLAGPPTRLTSNFIAGPKTLPVSFTPGPRRG